MPANNADVRKKTLLNSVSGGVFTCVVWLILALISSIVIEVVGMKWWWPDEGVQHSYSMVQYELNQLRNEDDGLIMTRSQRVFAEKMLAFQESALIFVGVERLLNWIKEPIKDNNYSPKAMLRAGYLKSKDYIEASLNIIKVFSLRLAILILSLPLFLFALFIGMTDGIVERDLRRWGGGRESSTHFDIAKACVLPMAMGAWLIYLSLPMSINPAFIIIPFVLLFGFAVRVTTERFKKYF